MKKKEPPESTAAMHSSPTLTSRRRQSAMRRTVLKTSVSRLDSRCKNSWRARRRLCWGARRGRHRRCRRVRDGEGEEDAAAAERQTDHHRRGACADALRSWTRAAGGKKRLTICRSEGDRCGALFNLDMRSDKEGMPFDVNDLKSEQTLWSLYNRWLSYFNMARASVSKDYRFNIFKDSVRYIYELKGADPKNLELNHLCDVTIDELCPPKIRRRGH
ncbi:hypothetical protein C2845_PM13G21200 [Panicum miliaceum]|uniref:Cathepsin propeptide inhibitor domain-containing protein n=1 Tax=Panicum miliaceum TaxID=4540 RepID=A0A3L6RGH0_PANMI|nr:hypothetical protein C2845_PM13G21200 [Panicum miliaceum]